MHKKNDSKGITALLKAAKTRNYIDTVALFNFPKNDSNEDIEAISEPNEAKQSHAEGKSKIISKPNRSHNRAISEPNEAKQSHIKDATEAISKPNRSQIGAVSRTQMEPTFSINEVFGLQKKVLMKLFKICLISGSKTTLPSAIENIVGGLESTPAAVKKAIQRLEQKGLIERSKFQRGRGGWTRYSIPESVYKDLYHEDIEAISEPNRSQIGAVSGTQIGTEIEPKAPSSSSYINTNIKPTTTRDLDPELFDATLLQKFGFGINHIKQCLERGWGFDKHPMELQQSIFHIHAAISSGILATPKGPGLIMEQLKRGKYHAPESIKANDVNVSLDKAMSWWESLPMEKRMKLQEAHNFDRMKSNDDKRAKIVEFYDDENTFQGTQV